MQGFTDETDSCVQQLNSLTHLVHIVFNSFKYSNVPSMTITPIVDLLQALEARGVMTMIGFRKTQGSQEKAWPSSDDLLETFNKPNQILTEEERQRLKKLKNQPSKLTVGARALCKHAHRSSEGFWGDPRGTELVKNQYAAQKASQIIKDCVWVNLHLLPHQEMTIECRIELGYGMRWTLKENAFRGFLEP